MIGTLFHVAIGGAAGAVARYLTGLGVVRLTGPAFPYGTLAINVVGSFAMGLLFALLVERGDLRHVALLMTGVLSGFTTFSAFSLDALLLVERGEAVAAALYVAGSVGLSLLGIVAGVAIGRGAAA